MKTTIRRIRLLDDTIRRTGGFGKDPSNGDNWHMTWASNGSQYVGLCDGYGWSEMVGYKGVEYNTRVFEMSGPAENPTYRHLEGFPDLFNDWKTWDSSRYYGFGILAIGETIYHYLSTPNRPFLVEDFKDHRFIGAKLAYSPDLGQTWLNQDGSPLVWEPWEERNRDNMVFFNEPGNSFSLITVLQMGRGYEQNTDGYVYIYSPNGSTEGTMNQLALARVLKDRILDRSAYEFYKATEADGQASWTPHIEERGVMHTFPSGWVNTNIHPYAWHPSVVYNAGLGLYMMANWGMGTDESGDWFTKPGYLGIWVAETPWGPWKQVHEDTAWTPGGDQAARIYQPQISPGWISPDGRSFWLVWTDFQIHPELPPLDQRPYYCFNWMKVEILTD